MIGVISPYTRPGCFWHADAEIKKVLAAYRKSPEPKKNATSADAPDGSDTFKGFKMEFVVIGNPNNEGDDTGYGAVPYTYRISKYEVSEAMIAAYNKRNPKSKIGGSLRGPDRPVTGVGVYGALHFVNWLNTSQGHQAAYNFTEGRFELWEKKNAWQLGGENLYRHKDAKYFLPSENEWYKAAYYDPKANDGAGGYWDYATGSDTAPLSMTASALGGGDIAPKTAVIRDHNPHVHEPSNISRSGGLSPHGTMAQNGNVWEWGESAKGGGNDSAVESRVLRGGGWFNSSGNLQSSHRTGSSAGREDYAIGFRVAAVPE